MAQFKTKIILTLKTEGVTYLADEVLDIDEARAAEINKTLETAFPTLSPVLVPVDAEAKEPEEKKPTKDELKAELKELGVEYPAKATVAQLSELLETAKK